MHYNHTFGKQRILEVAGEECLVTCKSNQQRLFDIHNPETFKVGLEVMCSLCVCVCGGD